MRISYQYTSYENSPRATEESQSSASAGVFLGIFLGPATIAVTIAFIIETFSFFGKYNWGTFLPLLGGVLCAGYLFFLASVIRARNTQCRIQEILAEERTDLSPKIKEEFIRLVRLKTKESNKQSIAKFSCFFVPSVFAFVAAVAFIKGLYFLGLGLIGQWMFIGGLIGLAIYIGFIVFYVKKSSQKEGFSKSKEGRSLRQSKSSKAFQKEDASSATSGVVEQGPAKNADNAFSAKQNPLQAKAQISNYQSPTVNIPQPDKKMFCRICGERLPGNSKYCFKCGAEVISNVINIDEVKVELDKLKKEIVEIEKDLVLSVTDPIIIKKAADDGLTPEQYWLFSRLNRNEKQAKIINIIAENNLVNKFEIPIWGCFNSASVEEIMSSREFEEAFLSLDDFWKEKVFLQPDRKLDAAQVINSLTRLVGRVGNDSELFAVYIIAFRDRVRTCRSLDVTARNIKRKLPNIYEDNLYKIIAFTEIRFSESSPGFYISNKQDADKAVQRANEYEKEVEAQKKAASLSNNGVSRSEPKNVQDKRSVDISKSSNVSQKTQEEAVFYLQAANGMTVRVPESQLESWSAAQDKIREEMKAGKAVEPDPELYNELLKIMKKQMQAPQSSESENNQEKNGTQRP